MRHRLRRIAAALCTLALAVAGAVFLPAGSAQAAASGAGWSSSWRYSSTDQLFISGGVPGAQISIGASDVGGVRTLFPLLLDTKLDGLCAGLVILNAANDAVMPRMLACNTSIFQQAPPIQGKVTLILFVGTPEGSIAGPFYVMPIPDLGGDAKVDGTGFSWRYVDDSNFTFEMVLPGARITGHGAHDPGVTRSAQFTIAWTGGSACVQGLIDSETNHGIPGQNIAVACPFGNPATGRRNGMENYIELTAVSGSHSLKGVIALPNNGPH